MARRKPIPVCLLTGYLGSGKTTLMNNILNQQEGYHVAVIVNDVGEVNIDARLIAKGGNIQKEDSDSVVSLSNGCACCTLKADLIEQLKQLSDSGKFDYILIEASGAGNPVYLAQTIELMDQALGRKSKTPLVYLDNIITVADAYRFVQEFECGDSIMKEDVDDEDVEKLLIEQLEFCNTVLLNKVDLVSAEELEHVKSVVKALAPEAQIIETTKSVVDMKYVLGTGAFDFEKVAGSAGWIKALESTAAEEEEHEHEEEEHEHHHHHDEDEEEHEHHHHHHDEDEDEHEHHCCHHHDDEDEDEHEHHCCHHHDEEDDEHEHHDHGPNCTCGCHGHHHHHHVKYGIETFVYYRRRPFNQPKFAAVVKNWRQNVIRSKGFVWFDDDRIRAYVYEQAGKQITLQDDGLWVDAEDPEVRKEILAANPELLEEWDDVYGDRMIRLVFIGKNMDKKAMIKELDAALSE